MTDRQLLSRHPEPSPTSSDQSSAPVEGVMQILAQSARRRLGIFATVFTGAFGVGFILSLALPRLLGEQSTDDWIMSTLTGFLTMTSLMLASVARNKHISPSRLVDLGLIYVVLGCLSMSGAEVLLGPATGQPRSGISGICVWLVMFPLIIPSAPTKALIAAMIGASMLPFSYVIGLTVGNPPLSTSELVEWFLPLYFCAGLSYAAARSVYSWGSALAENERKMAELGSYQLVERLAAGGMGVVYRARHRFLPRDAAVKLIDTARLASDSQGATASHLAQLFEREAHSIAMLESPHTVALFDYGLSDAGELYYVMELLRGSNLQNIIELTGPMSSARVIHILNQVCLSLSEAHHKELIHRDIKPGNIVAGPFGGQFDFVKVLDFGLANIVGAVQAEQKQGVVIGTPGYIAPEVLTGSSIDHRSDLYSVGCVGYFLLTGHTVFEDGESQNMVAHIRRQPRPLIEIVPEVDSRLAALIHDCLAKKPEQRPDNAATLRRMLNECVISGDWTQSRAEAWWDEHHDLHVVEPGVDLSVTTQVHS